MFHMYGWISPLGYNGRGVFGWMFERVRNKGVRGFPLRIGLKIIV